MNVAERRKCILSGKTHLFVGTATTLFVMQPEKVSEVCLCLSVGICGALISDIDVVSSKAHKLVNKVTIATACLLGLLVLIDKVLGLNFLESSTIVKIIIGAAIFCLVCIYGKDQPHRAFMHSFTALFLLSFSLYLICPMVVPYFAISMASHMIIDLLNYINVRLFFPVKWGLSFDVCHADSEGNKAIGVICMVFTLVQTVFFLGKIMFVAVT